jgi:hypothetical protein
MIKLYLRTKILIKTTVTTGLFSIIDYLLIWIRVNPVLDTSPFTSRTVGGRWYFWRISKVTQATFGVTIYPKSRVRLAFYTVVLCMHKLVVSAYPYVAVTAGRSWMRVAEDRARWRDIGEAYVHQWTVMG